ncbi:MAG: phosphatidylserine decarboxylase family protein [Bacteroidia bacterium]|nr:phosphatidylserine decarboxylase family protein [Bacteroidia bacterium]
MIHREGYWYVFVSILASAAIIFLLFRQTTGTSYKWLAYLITLICLVLTGLVLNFFRNPTRTVVQNPKHILAPCDGKVVVLEEVMDSVFLNQKVRQISIFMSPLNVHVNRNPISGVVKFFQYYPGEYLVAWHPKSSEKNERTYAVVENQLMQVAYKQIAGAVARRICYYIKTGDTVQQGAEFGFIKFGSRMDILIPLHATVKVNLNEKTVGGQTILATVE